MTDYDADLALWAQEQAARLRAGALAELDRENIAEELETLARALHLELDERLARLIQSLLQWALIEGDRRPGWYVTIQEERDMIPRLLEDAPSLRQHWPETFARAWRRAQDDACAATGLTRALLPSACPFTGEQILDVAFWPATGSIE